MLVFGISSRLEEKWDLVDGITSCVLFLRILTCVFILNLG